MTAVPDSHCAACGAPFADLTGWPRVCAVCGQIAYKNPLPVAVALVPVGRGVLVTVRGPAVPGAGQAAFPGGYVEWGESWQQALCRELREETGLMADPAAVRHFWTASNPAGTHILIFGLLPPLAALPSFTPNPETAALRVVSAPERLAFSLHTAALARFFGAAVPDPTEET